MVYADRERFTVRVLRRGSAVAVGMGFIIADGYVVTCAHVVNAALGLNERSQDKPGPEDLIEVDFPTLSPSVTAATCKYEVVSWHPPPPGTGVSVSDVAGLVIAAGERTPPEAGPARLIDPSAVRDAQVSVFGYPPSDERTYPQGGWARHRALGGVGGGLLQLEAVPGAAFTAQPGFSGSPVVAVFEGGDVVIGMFTAGWLYGREPDSLAIPVSELARAWPDAIEASAKPASEIYGDQYGYAPGQRFLVRNLVRELPAAPQDFGGRADEIRRLTEWLTTGPSPRVVNIYGIPGSGKTALALRVAQEISGKYRGCQLYFDLRSSDQSPVSIDDLLDSKLMRLGVPAAALPAGLEARAQAYRSEIDRRPSLIVIDNVTSQAQVRHLIPGAADVAVIVTSWTLIPELSSYALPLPPLADDEAVGMLATVSRRAITDDDQDDVLRVVRLLGNLPLALRIAGGHMRTQQRWTWKGLGDRLSLEAESAQARPLVIGSPEAQASFDLAYQELEPETAEGYRLLGLAPSATMSRELALELISADRSKAEDVLDQLVARQWLHPEDELTFRMNDLLWMRARFRVARDEDSEARRAANGRLTNWSLRQLRTSYLEQFAAGVKFLPPIPSESKPLSLEKTYVHSELTAADLDDWVEGRLEDLFPAEFERLVLMAPGGSGKTTMIGNLCLLAAERYQAGQDAGERIPLVVLIRDIRPAAAEDNLESLIISMLKYRYDCEQTPEALRVALGEGQVFVVADGLDELIEPKLRRRVMRSINDFSRRYPKVPMLIATRPFAEIRDEFPDFTVATIAPWDKVKADTYLTQLNAVRRGRTDISPLLTWMRSQDHDLGALGTPLGLQMLLFRYWRRQDIPQTFTLLVEAHIEEITYRRDHMRGISVNGGGQVRVSAEKVAFAMQTSYEYRTAISYSDIIQVLSSDHAYPGQEGSTTDPTLMAYWLVDGRGGFMRMVRTEAGGERFFAFLHTAYREHLAASHLERMDQASFQDIVRRYVADLSWAAIFEAFEELRIMRRTWPAEAGTGDSGNVRPDRAETAAEASILWDARFGGWVSGSVAVLGDNLVAARLDGTVATLNTTEGLTPGEPREFVKVEDELRYGPLTVTQGGRDRAYVGSSDGRVIEIDLASGRSKVIMTARAGIEGTPVAVDEQVCVVSADGLVHLADPRTGRARVLSQLGAAATGTLAASSGAVFVADVDGHVHAISTRTGARYWSLPTGGLVLAPPLPASEWLYVGGTDGILLQVGIRDGVARDSRDLGAPIHAAPVRDGNMVYAGSSDGMVYAYEIGGQGRSGLNESWKTALNEEIGGLAASSGGVYVTAGYRLVWAGGGAAGESTVLLNVNYPICAPPVISGQRCYVVGLSGVVTCLALRP